MEITMQYNHKANQSLIDRAKAEGKDVRKIAIRVDEIQRKQIRTGDYIITIVAKEDKRKYSAFENVWTAQNIDITQLNEGDTLDIVYAINGDYFNFL